MRIGQGYDAHALAPGRRLVLGGVEVPHDRGLAGFSDGDALIHAVIDALLGAANLGDIGRHFPTGDPRYQDIASVRLLASTAEMLREAGWRVVNLDATIAAERPKLAPHIPAMQAAVAQALGVDASCVSIKATTADGLGFTGREEGVAALAVALIEGRE